MRIILLFILSVSSYYTVANPHNFPAKIAIIIDDIGYRKTDSNVLNLPNNITLSILPHTPYGKSLALQGFKDNHDVMLHIPMEAQNGKFLGPGGLTSNMSEKVIRNKLEKAFKEIPFAIGVNNHMGSLLTTLYQPMVWVMQYLKERRVFFIDSSTSPKSLANTVAKELNVSSLERSVFLDNKLDHAYIANQFNLLIEQAKINKVAIAIAHPHPETIQSLLKLIPLLASQNIELVSVSQLVTYQESLLSKRNTNKLP